MRHGRERTRVFTYTFSLPPLWVSYVAGVIVVLAASPQAGEKSCRQSTPQRAPSWRPPPTTSDATQTTLDGLFINRLLLAYSVPSHGLLLPLCNGAEMDQSTIPCYLFTHTRQIYCSGLWFLSSLSWCVQREENKVWFKLTSNLSVLLFKVVCQSVH